MYELGQNMLNKPAPKLTPSHIHPNNFEKMKVKLATQALSSTVAAGIETFVQNGIFHSQALTTSAFIRNFDNLFDMLNSSKKTVSSSKIHKRPYKGTEFQKKFLDEMSKFISKLRVWKTTKKRGFCETTNRVVFINCWLITINSIKSLWDVLKNEGFNCLYTRYLNQDPIEQLFGDIREINGLSCNPTALQFTYNFKKLFFIKYSNSGTGNCTNDYGDVIQKLSQCSKTSIFEKSNNDVPIPTNYLDEVKGDTVELTNSNLKITEQNFLNYVCGYLLSKCLRKHSNCPICENYAQKNIKASKDASMFYIQCRAYDKINNKLCTPPISFINYISQLDKLFFERFYIIATGQNVIQEYVKLFSAKKNYSHPCSNFPYTYLLKLYTRIRLFYTLKFININFKSQKGASKRIVFNTEIPKNEPKSNRKIDILSHK